MAFTYGEYSESGDYTIEKKVKYVEYIESDGASWIDTGIITNGNTQIEVTAELINFDKYKSWFGSDKVSVGYQVQAQNLSFKIQGNGVSKNLGNTTYALGKHTWKIDTSNIEIGTERYTVNIDGVDLIPFTPSKNENPTMSLKVFSANTHGDSGGDLDANNCCIQGRIYDFKIYMDNELIMHLKPCVDTSKVPCMYDEVSKQYFYNQGTGTFIVGGYNLYLFADNQDNVATNLGNYRLYDMKIEGDSQGIENNRDTVDYVDCLIGDGASYINTGIAVSTGYKIDVTFMSTVSRINGGNLTVALFGASAPIFYAYDVEPYGIALGLYNYNLSTKNGGNVKYANFSDICYNKKYTHSMIAENVSNTRPLFLFALNFNGALNDVSGDMIRIYDFKIHNAEGTLIQHLRPCIDASKVPCMYDEVSQQYFYNQGTGTFGYKKELRDFQPVLDSNNVPCLMDKLNRKYYYDKNGNVFNSQEEVKYRRIPYIQGDGNSWLDIGQFNFDSNTRLEVKVAQPEWRDVRECIINNSGNLLMTLFKVNNNTNKLSYRVGTVYGGDTSSFNLGINIPHVFTMTQTEITYDGNIIANPTSYGDISQTNIYLLKEWSVNTTHATATSQLYYFKIYQSDELVFNGIPVLDQDNIPCMYDLVTDTFFYNQGTGTFAYGIEELECPLFDQVDCIYRAKYNNSDYFRTKNLNGLVDENLIIKTKIKLGKKDQNNAFFQIVGQYNVNRTAITYSASNKRFEACFLGNNCYASLDDYEVLNDDILEIQLSKDGLYVNNTFIGELSTTNFNLSFVIPLYIFQQGGYQDTTIGNSTEGSAIYYITFEQNGEAVANFVPALDDEGVLCFYESVDDIYYYPTIGTSFSYNTRLSTPIKYIESDGTQYIDTGVRITNNISVDMICRESKEYTQVEYLQGDSVSWLNLNIIPDTTTKVVVDFYAELNDCFNGIPLFASRSTFLSFTFQTSVRWTTVGKLGSNHSIGDNTLPSDVFVGRHTVTIDLSDTVNVVNIDGVNYGTNSGTTTECANPILIFNDYNPWNQNRSENLSTAKIYSFKIYKSNELVFDGMPVLDSENTPCLYDKISGTFFYNQGTGTFAYGDVITKNYIMNNLYSQNTYKCQDTNTTVQPNLTVSEGATLTLGETNLSYLSEKEIEDATNDGWNLL